MLVHLSPGDRLADLLLRREALLARAGEAPTPHDFAGLVLDDSEVTWLMEHASSDTPAHGPGDALRAELEPAIETARRDLDDELARRQSPVSLLADAAALEPTAAQVLAVLVAVELDGRRQRLVAFVQNDVNRHRPTVALVRRLFGEDGLAAVAPNGPLRRAGLIVLEDGGGWSATAIAVPPAVCWAAAGNPGHDPQLPLGLRASDGAEGPRWPRAALLAIAGSDAAARQAVAHQAGIARLLTCAPPESDPEWEALIRHAAVTGRGILLELEELSTRARHWVERAAHLTWVLSSRHELPLSAMPARPWRELRASEAPADDDEWSEILGQPAPPGLRLSRGHVEQLATATGALDGDLGAAVRRLASGELHLLTRRVSPRRGWRDIVLPADQYESLVSLCDRYRHRATVYDRWEFTALPSAGLLALFSGPSGTGKTLAAEIVAGELGLDLYKLDLSSVVSKYIGETEKNLERVFSAASAGDVVLFFDEADALFGKRSDVSDAHDRYANIEVSYLLQRVEAHDGLVVLASNYQQNIDAAFLRRIHVLVDFPEPDETQRRQIWARSFPPVAPVGDLDTDFLATRFKLTGGSIRNAALHAAFLAAAEDSGIEMSHVVRGVRRELRKLGRLCPVEDFGEWAHVLDGEQRAASVG